MPKKSWSAFAFLLLVFLPNADAQQKSRDVYPNHPIRFLVPFTVGGSADIVARTIAQGLSDELGQQVVVDNRPGSGGIVGTAMAATSSADGYTLSIGNISTIAVSQAVYRKLPYDSIKDFYPVTLISSSPFVMLVPASLPAQSVKEFVALAKSKPGKLNYASTGVGAPGHLAAELLATSTGIKMEHVPYKDISQAFVDMYAGQVQLFFIGIAPSLLQIKTGKLRALAVTSEKRSPEMADCPTVAESGVPNFDVTGWYGLFMPAGTPQKIVTKMNAAMKKIAANPELQKRFSAIGADLMTDTPEQFSAFVKTEIKKWAKVVKNSGIRIE